MCDAVAARVQLRRARFLPYLREVGRVARHCVMHGVLLILKSEVQVGNKGLN